MKRPVRKSGRFQKLLASYLLVFAIPAFLSALLLGCSLRLYTQEETRYHQVVLEQIKSDLDASMKKLLEISYQISLNDSLNSVMYVQNSFDESHRYDLYLLQQELKQLCDENDFIKEMYLYFPRTDTILNKKNHVSKDLYYQLYLEPLSLDRSSWQAVISDTFFGGMGTFSVRENSVDSTLVYFVQSIPAYRSLNANLVIVLNPENILQKARNLNFEKGDEFTVLDKNDKTLLTSNPKRYLYHSKDALLNSRSTYVVNSDVLPIRYLSIFFAQTANQRFWAQMLFGIVPSILLLFVGILAALFFSRKNYQPFLDIIHNIEPHFRAYKGDEELSYIQTALEEWGHARFFKALVQNDVPSAAVQADGAVQPGYLLLMVRVISPEQKGAVKAMLESLIRADMTLATSEVGDKILGIFRLEETQLESVKSAVREGICHLPPEIKVAVSRFSRPGSLKTDYSQTLNALDCILPTQQQLVFCEEEAGGVYLYSAEIRAHLSELAALGQMDVLREELAQMNREASIPQKEMLENLLYSLLSACLSRAETDGGIPLFCGLQPYRQMEQASTTGEKITVFLRLVQTIVTQPPVDFKEKKENRQEQIAARVQAYIDENFREQELNVYSIGSEFALTPYYVSKIFKEVTGFTILNYLDQQRVEQAKLLLLQDASLASIAEECGYTDSHALIRAFKKQMGMTPGRYKEMNQSNEIK